MGPRVSSLTKISNDVLNKSMTDILQRNATNVSTNLQSGQSAKFTVLNSVVECVPSDTSLINQSIQTNISMVDQITQETSSEIKNLLKNAADSTSTQFQKITQELGGGLGLNAKQEQDISTKIQNIIETSVTQENLTSSAKSVSITQSGDVLISGTTYKGPCSITQDLALSMQASAIIGNVMKAVSENQAVTEIVTTATQKQEVELKGLSDIVKSIGDAVSNILLASMAPLIVAGIVLVLVFPMLGGLLGGKAPKVGPDGKVVDKGSSGLKVAGITFLVSLLLFIIVVVILYLTKTWPFKETHYPPNVEEKKCTEEYDRAIKVKKEYNSATDEEAKKQVLITHKDTLTQYNDCMGLSV
jgi:hypothetical protein